MLAWEWTLEKARDGEGEVEKKAATTTRKISQTAQVQMTFIHSYIKSTQKRLWISYMTSMTKFFILCFNQLITQVFLKPDVYDKLSVLRLPMIPVMATTLSQ